MLVSGLHLTGGPEKKMAKQYVFPVLAFILLCPVVSFSADAKDPVDTIERMAGEVIKHYPRAEGKVASADEKTVTVDIGSADGLKPGMELYLFRPGKLIKHPVTKAVLGTMETSLGSMVLLQVGEKESTGELKELLVTRIIEGDIARTSDKKTKLLVGVHGKDPNELVLDRLLNIMRSSGRFDVKGPVELPKEFPLGADPARKLLLENGSDNLLALSTSPTKNANRIQASLTLYGADGGTSEKQEGLLDSTSDVYAEKEMDYNIVRGEHRDFYHLENLPYRAKHFTAGNINGEGKTEFAISDGHAIIIYRLEGGVLKELWREAAVTGNEHLDVECADLNHNGRDEVYVTNFNGGVASSYVIEYDGSRYQKVADSVPLLFRVLDVPGSGKALIATTVGKDAPYSGIIDEYKWKDGSLVNAGRFPLPGKIKDPYGFVLADLVHDKKGAAPEEGPLAGLEIVWIDDSDYLQVLSSKGKRLWKSPERFGGYDSFFEVDQNSLALANVDNRGKVKGKLIVRGGPEGTTEIVLTKNIPVTNMVRRIKLYSGAEIYSMAWNGSAMDIRWSIKNIEGYLADIHLGDVSNKGREEIAIITEPTFKYVKSSKSVPLGSAASLGNIVSDRASLLIYKVPQR